MSRRRLFDPDPASKPSKPYHDYPLFAHANGCWAKKIRGRLHYFGVWVGAGPDHGADTALKLYLEQKDALHAGRSPRPDPAALTVKDVANAFLNAKKARVDAGELAVRTWQNYKIACDAVVEAFGKSRLVADLGPDDFTALRNRLTRWCGPVRLGVVITCIRSAF